MRGLYRRAGHSPRRPELVGARLAEAWESSSGFARGAVMSLEDLSARPGQHPRKV